MIKPVVPNFVGEAIKIWAQSVNASAQEILKYGDGTTLPPHSREVPMQISKGGIVLTDQFDGGGLRLYGHSVDGDNAPVTVKNSLILPPSPRPQKVFPGFMYFDQATSQFLVSQNGTTLVPLIVAPTPEPAYRIIAPESQTLTLTGFSVGTNTTTITNFTGEGRLLSVGIQCTTNATTADTNTQQFIDITVDGTAVGSITLNSGSSTFTIPAATQAMVSRIVGTTLATSGNTVQISFDGLHHLTSLVVAIRTVCPTSVPTAGVQVASVIRSVKI